MDGRGCEMKNLAQEINRVVEEDAKRQYYEIAEQLWPGPPKGLFFNVDAAITELVLRKTNLRLSEWKELRSFEERLPFLKQTTKKKKRRRKAGQNALKCESYHPVGTPVPDAYQQNGRPCGPFIGHESKLAYTITGKKVKKLHLQLRIAARDGLAFVHQIKDRQFQAYCRPTELHNAKKRFENYVPIAK